MLLDVFGAMDSAKKFIVDRGIETPIFITRIETRVYGWVFCWNSLEYVQTGVAIIDLVGNRPLFVAKAGEVFLIRKSKEDFLKEWETEHKLEYLYPNDHGLERMYASDNSPFRTMDEFDALEEARRGYLKQLES